MASELKKALAKHALGMAGPVPGKRKPTRYIVICGKQSFECPERSFKKAHSFAYMMARYRTDCRDKVVLVDRQAKPGAFNRWAIYGGLGMPTPIGRAP